MSKTTASRKPKRSVRIHSMPSGARVEVRYASSLKQALEEFYKDRLAGAYTKDKIIGNVMLVSDAEKTYEFRAYEEAPPKSK